MKQDKARKTPKWVLPVAIAAAVLVVVGIVLAIFLGPWNQGGSNSVYSKLYWNIDRKALVDPDSGMSLREPGADGLYTIRFAVDGEQVEYKAADKRLVNSIDFMDVMGLVFDADGLIIEALAPNTIYTEVAKEFFVKSVSADKIVVNSSLAMNGMEVEVPLSDTTGVYIVDPAVGEVGLPGTCEVMDRVSVYADADGNTTHVFMMERARGDGVYFRADQFYDKKAGSTTREPDENGIYTMPFAYEGELLDLKCKDKDLVSKLDSLYNPKHHVGLIFDEEGYIVDFVTAAVALRGKLKYGYMSVTAADGNTVTIEDIVGEGADGEADLYIDEECDVFLVEDGCEAEFIGQRVDSLQVGDLIYVYTDLEDKPILIYIYRRPVEAQMYYNVSRKYNSTDKVTTRTPDENGWYVYDMITLNKRVELRTKDIEIATKVDSFSGKVMGLKVEGTTIVDVYHPYCLSGYSHVGEGRYVTMNMSNIIRIVSSTNFESGGNYMTAEGHIMIDATGDYSAKVGAQVTLREGDRVTAYTNPGKQISHGVVMSRYYEGTKLYYNINRSYRTSQKETTREPDENGYYVFDMVCEGKEVQVKTKDKAMASFIDADSGRFRALKVSNGIVKEAYQDVSAMKYGVRVLNNYYYDSTNPDGTINFYYYTSGESGEERIDRVTTYTVSADAKTYNYSDGYTNYKGERTTLQKGDRISAYASRETNQILSIFVRERKVDSKLYWYTERKYTSTTKETTREPDANGYYVVDLISEDGQIKTFKTKDKKVMSKVDSYATAFGLKLKGDVIIQAYPHTTVKGIGGYAAGYYDATELKKDSIVFTRNRPASSSTGKTAEYPISSKLKVVNVSPYSDKYGAKDKIAVGDRLASYTNEDGEIICSFIVNKNTHKAGAISYCEHCDKEVWWEHFNGTIYDAEAHYYLTSDYTSKKKSIGYNKEELAADETLEQYEVVLDLNGYTWTSESSNVIVYSTFSIVDTVGGGKMVAKDRCVTLSSIGGATLNLYGGTLTESETEPTRTGGIIYANSGTINMYGGTITGGIATKGGNLYIAGTKFNMYGGTISDGYATGVGGNIYAFGNSVLNIQGGLITGGISDTSGGNIELAVSAMDEQAATFANCTISDGTAPSNPNINIMGNTTYVRNVTLKDCVIGGDMGVGKNVNIIAEGNVQIENGKTGGIKLPSGSLIDISKLSKKSKIVVFARGVFTTERDDIADFVNCFVPAMEGATIVQEGKALAYVGKKTEYTIEQIIETTNSADFAALFANGGSVQTVCPVCGEEVEWTPVTGPVGERADGHYYLNNEADYEHASMNYLTLSNKTCLYLNNKEVKINGRFRASKELHIMGPGKITRLDNDKYPETPMFNLDSSNTKLHIYGGTFINQQAGVALFNMTSTYSTGSLKIYGGTFESTAGDILVMDKEKAKVELMGGTFKTGDLKIDAGNLKIGSATVKGSVIVAKGVELTLADTPVISKVLDLTSGAKANVSGLNTDASIVVKANGIFTIASTKAPYLIANNTFKPYTGYQDIANVANRLWTDKIGNDGPVEADPKTTEEIIEITNSADFAAKFANGGVVTAFCPVCGIDVEWTPIGAGTADDPKTTETKLDDHVYYDQDTWTTSVNILTSKTDISCLYLNGKTVTGTGRIRANRTINIMGSGKIIRNKGEHEQPMFNLDSTYTKLSIYGGTYINNYSSMPLFSMCNENSKGSLKVYAGTFESKSPEVLLATNASAKVELQGGTFKSGAVKMDAGSLKIGSATAKGNVVAAQDVELTLTGTPTISGVLDLTSGAKAKLSSLSTSASINVKAKGFFTLPSRSANTYLTAGTFIPAEGYQSILVNANRLWTNVIGAEPPAEPTPMTTEEIIELTNSADFAAKFANGGVVTAFCPVCGVDVEWTPIGAGTAEEPKTTQTELLDHVYYDQDTWTTSQNILTSGTDISCLYLNGKTVTGIGRIRASRTLNIMGSGKIVRNDGEFTNPMFNLDSSYSNVSIYGGEYVNNKADAPLFDMTSVYSTGSLKIYGGTFESAAAEALLVNKEDADVELLGGTIKSGNLKMEAGYLKIGSATVKGNVVAAQDVELTLTGTPTISGVLDLTSGVKAKLSSLSSSASIKVKANGFFTHTSLSAQTYATNGTFVPVEGYQNVVANANRLWTNVIGVEAPPVETPKTTEEIIALANSAEFAAKFANGGVVTAFCPVCGVDVEWAPIGGGTEAEPLSSSTDLTDHVYYDQDTWTKSQNTLTGNTDVACLYLNGKTVTGIGRIRASKTINILGSGKIIKTEDQTYSEYSNSMFYLDSANTKLSIYGGEFINKHAELPLFAMTSVNSTGSLKVYAGTFNSVSAPALVENNTRAKVELYGGTFKNGALQADLGNLTISNVTLEDDVVVSKLAMLQLTGKPTITGTLDLTSGAKAVLNVLDTEANILVKANGLFTREASSLSKYVEANTFKVPEGYLAVAVAHNALWTDVIGAETPAAPVYLTPEEIISIANSEEFGEKFAEGGDVIAQCPACNEEVVWIPVTGNSVGTKKEGHYYLNNPEAVHGSQDFLTVGDVTDKLCVYLNDMEVTLAGHISANRTLNLLGNGKLIRSDSKYDGVNGGNVVSLLDATSTYSNLNVYGGTYINNEPNMPLIRVNNTGKVNIYGGTFENAVGAALNMTNGTVNLAGGTFKKGDLEIEAGKVIIGNAVVKNNVVANAAAELQLTGKPTISGVLDLTGGAKASLEGLDTTARITVKAKGTFTKPTDNADAYITANTFTPAAGYQAVQNKNNALWTQTNDYVPPVLPTWSDDTLTRIDQWTNFYKEDFADGVDVTTAICPVCGAEDVVWTAKTDAITASEGQKHFYFSEGITYTGANLINVGTYGVKPCVYLNGQNITMTTGTILVNNGLNLIGGTGSITKQDSDGTTGFFRTTGGGGTDGVVNIYGGTYEHQDLDAKFFRDSTKNTWNIYGATFKYTGTVATSIIEKTGSGAFNLHSGTINCGVGTFDVGGGKINLLGGTLIGNVNMNKGELTIGDAIVQGNVNVAAEATVVLSGAPMITGGSLTLANGVVANIENLAATASIPVSGAKGKVISAASNNAAAVKDCFTVVGDATLYVDVTTDKQLFITDGTVVDPGEGENPGGGENPTVPTWSDDIPTRINQWTDFYGTQFTGETVETAICPICGATDVTWSPKNSTYTSLAPGSTASHYYLSESYGRTTQDMIGITQSASLCLYLNNKTYTTIGRFLVKNQVNIFDDVQTAGGGITRILNTYATAETPSKTGYLSLPMFDVSVNGDVYGELNIYGGHYENQQTIVGTYNPNGTTAIRVDNANAALNIYGGSFANTGNGMVLDAVSGAVKIAGGSISGSVNVAADASIALSGATTIAGSGLTLAADVKADVTDLATGSNIVVNGVKDQVIATNGDATKATYFTVSGNANLVVKANADNELYITEGSGSGAGGEVPTWSDDVSTRINQWTDFYGAQFTGESVETAICPVCGDADVTWHPRYGTLNGTTGLAISADGYDHWYLSDNVTRNSFYTVGSSQSAPICVYLNNKTYSTTGTFNIKNTLNIFDDPDVTGGKMIGADGTTGAGNYVKMPLLRLESADTKLNIYYGEYVSEQPFVTDLNVNGTALIGSGANSGQAYIYGATLQNTHYGEVLRAEHNVTVELENCELKGGNGYVDGEGVTYGGNIYMTNGTVTLKNTTVTGGTATNGSVYVGGGTLKLAGTTSIATNGLTLATDVYADVTDLATTSGAIVVNGVKDQKIAVNGNADKAAMFTAPTGLAVNADGTDLVIGEPVLEPVVPTWSSDIPTRINQWTDFYGAQFTGDSVETAICPVCGDADVKWYPRSGNNSLAISGEKDHWYLSDNVVRTTFDAIGTGHSAPICVYLNNKTYSTTGSFQIKNTLNFFDDPDVAGGKVLGAVDTGKGDNYVTLPVFFANGTAPELNAYYGEYEMAQPHVAGENDTGTALFGSTSTATKAYFYGVTLKNTGYGEILRVTKGDTFVFENCTLNGGSGYVNAEDSKTYGGNIYMEKGTVTLKDTTVAAGTATNGSVYVADGTLKLSGKTSIAAPGLVLATDVKVTLDALDPAADITVKADGAFTVANDDAAKYVTAFKPAEGYRDVYELDKVLYTGVGASTVPQDAKTIIATANSAAFAAKFANGGKVTATCPVCKEEVEWTEVTTSIGSNKAGHFYLNHADNYSGHTSQNFLSQGGTTGGKVCLYLNNKSVKIAGRISATKEVNIMGNGTITRTDSDYDGNTAGKERCSLLNATSANTVLNIYGGTYVNEDPSVPLLYKSVSGTINIYAGTFVSATAAAMDVYGGAVNVYGGTVKGAVQVNAGNLKIGTANVIGNVTVADGAAIEQTGAPMIQGTLDLTSGVLATLTDLAAGTNVTVKAEGKFTAALDAQKATEYAALFTAAEGYETVTVVENALFTQAVPAQGA